MKGGSLADDVKKLARELGADLVGVASVDRFQGAPDEYHPDSLLPGTMSVISIAIRILRGVQIPQQSLKQNYQYQIFGYGWLSHIRLNWIAFEVARFLEDQGHVALPFPSFCDDQYGDKHPSWFRRTKPSISNRHAAVAAGIARLGWSNLAMTRQFGTRQRFVTIMTTAEIGPDPLIEEDLCDKCMICVKACPGKAISGSEAVKYSLAGLAVETGALNRPKCSWFHDGIATETFGTVPLAQPPDVTWEQFREARRIVDYASPSQFAGRITTFTTGGHCGLCILSCPKGTQWRPGRAP